MAELTTTLYLRLRSDIAGKANRDRRSFERLGRSGQRSFRRIEQSARRATSAIKRHGASAKQRFMRSTTSKIAAGIGLASIANLASQRQQQKAFLQATSGRAAKAIDVIYENVTNNTIATGQSVEKVGQFLQALQDMGGLLDVGVKTPKAPLRFFSNVMQGTGAAAQDVAKMSNILVQALDADKSLCDFGRTGQPRQRDP